MFLNNKKMINALVSLCIMFMIILISIKIIAISRIEHFRNNSWRKLKFNFTSVPLIKPPISPIIRRPSFPNIAKVIKELQEAKLNQNDKKKQNYNNNTNRSSIMFSPIVSIKKEVDNNNVNPVSPIIIQPMNRCRSSKCEQKNVFNTLKTNSIKSHDGNDVTISDKIIIKNAIDAKMFKVNGNNFVKYDKANNKLILG